MGEMASPLVRQGWNCHILLSVFSAMGSDQMDVLASRLSDALGSPLGQKVEIFRNFSLVELIYWVSSVLLAVTAEFNRERDFSFDPGQCTLSAWLAGRQIPARLPLAQDLCSQKRNKRLSTIFQAIYDGKDQPTSGHWDCLWSYVLGLKGLCTRMFMQVKAARRCTHAHSPRLYLVPLLFLLLPLKTMAYVEYLTPGGDNLHPRPAPQHFIKKNLKNIVERILQCKHMLTLDSTINICYALSYVCPPRLHHF